MKNWITGLAAFFVAPAVFASMSFYGDTALGLYDCLNIAAQEVNGVWVKAGQGFQCGSSTNDAGEPSASCTIEGVDVVWHEPFITLTTESQAGQATLAQVYNSCTVRETVGSDVARMYVKRVGTRLELTRIRGNRYFITFNTEED